MLQQHVGAASPRLVVSTPQRNTGRPPVLPHSLPQLSRRLGYSDQGKFNLVPMSYEALDYAAGEQRWQQGTGRRRRCWPPCCSVRSALSPAGALSPICAPVWQAGQRFPPARAAALCCPAGFCSEQVPEGFVAVAKNTLRVRAAGWGAVGTGVGWIGAPRRWLHLKVSDGTLLTQPHSPSNL